MSDTDKKHAELGMRAKVLLQLHLEQPENYTPILIVDRLFEVFENLDMEVPFDNEIRKEANNNEEVENR